MSTWPMRWLAACAMPPARTWRATSSDSFLELAREALADERVNGDDYATGLLLDMYGIRLGRTDKAAGMAALEQAVALFERAGRPSVEHARAIGYLVIAPNRRRCHDRHRGRRAGPGSRHRGGGAATWTRCSN